MAINSIENAVRYSTELDKMFAQKSATGFFADNALATKFVGAKTVIIPDVDFQGLADYDREAGYSKGAITVSNTSYTMAMDRARSLQIDREDMDETGIANLAGKILGEYVRTKVVPECDAYVLSKLGGLAISRSNFVNGDIGHPYETLTRLINKVQSVVGYDEELVAFVGGGVFAALQNSSEISKMITVNDFKQGDVNLKVKSINGVSIIPVVSERMKTAYTFDTGSAGGFKPLDTSREMYMLVLPKSAAHLVKKTENMRIFTPEQNIDADAYKFDYRIYYDVFVNKSALDAVWVWLSPVIEIMKQPLPVEVPHGEIDATLTIDVESSGEITYQWYECRNENKAGAVKVPDAIFSEFEVPTILDYGEHYYFVRVTVDDMISVDSRVAVVTVA